MQINDQNLEPGLETRPYITHRFHEFLNSDSGRREGPNIGLNGEHLTMIFLASNRSHLSIKLCRSIAEQIPDFKGEVLVIDNGSNEEERETLRRYLHGMPFRWRIEELGHNFGVAGGRNRALSHVRTEWVMSLDNDVYFIKNPLPQLQKDIAVLGCHFITMAILNNDAKMNFIRGGHLYLTFDMNEIFIGGGGTHQSKLVGHDQPGYLATFMSGNASVFRKDTFIAQGGFDEEMFAGFEDIEFSLRLFRSGMKVGASDVRALAHDDSKLETTDDIDGERTKFSRQNLKVTAEYFEKKHGYKIWTGSTDEWVHQRKRYLSPEIHQKRVCHSLRPGDCTPRPRIALVVDTNSWAFANIANEIIKHVSDEFEFDVLFLQDIVEPTLVLEMTKGHDLVHYLWRGAISAINENWERVRIDRIYGSWSNFIAEVVSPRPITFTVYDHLFLSPAEIERFMPMFTTLASGYSVCSRRLQEIYQNISKYPDPGFETPDGVDLVKFKPSKLERFAAHMDRPLRVGWSGNSAWGAHTKTGQINDPKGFHTILKPALQILFEKGIPVENVFADRQVKHIPHDQMPDYYNSIDVLVCCSEAEGTPNPVLEAMACGVPIVATDVGIVPEAFGPKQAKFILSERSPSALAQALEGLARSRSKLQELSEENQYSIKRWDWSIKTDAYRRLFRYHINARQQSK
ncbi:MAG: glycosyltransferase [Burkholderiaceae bacterium]|jgi:glycosyltransferase involved in cell wall biosynthesis/GT2 family glycosyltransferase|nr:glycosyltransferase [Burkholderiaceae bacterium]